MVYKVEEFFFFYFVYCCFVVEFGIVNFVYKFWIGFYNCFVVYEECVIVYVFFCFWSVCFDDFFCYDGVFVYYDCFVSVDFVCFWFLEEYFVVEVNVKVFLVEDYVV